MFNNLPSELIIKIYEYFKNKDIISFSLVCKKNRIILINEKINFKLIDIKSRIFFTYFNLNHSLSLPIKLFKINFLHDSYKHLVTNEIFKKLQGITYLSLAYQLFPNDDLKYLTPHIKTALLSSTNIDNLNLKYLATFNLNHIELNNTKITSEGLKYLENLKLKRLMLCKTKVIDDDLKYFQKVEEIFLGHTDINGDGFKYLIECKKLFLNETQITNESLKYLQNSKLKYLWLSGNENLTNEGLKYLSDLNLKQIELAYTRITDEGLKYLSNVEDLFLPNTNINGSGLIYLKKAIFIDLSFTDINDKNLLHLKNLNVKRVILYDTINVTSKGISFLKENNIKFE